MRAFALAAILALLMGGAAMAQDRTNGYPVPPCAAEAQTGVWPPYPPVGERPNIRVWRDEGIESWRPPACLGFAPLDANTVVATAGRFRLPGGVEELAGRAGRISKHTTIRYFSVRDNEWQPLFLQAYAIDDLVSAEPSSARRADFSAAELEAGRTFRFWQEENSLLSPVTYRLTVREHTEDRFVYAIVNESAAKAMFLRAIEPGEFRQLYTFEREQSDVWRYYGLAIARTRTGPFSLSPRSYINRAGAYYRYLAGIPTDMEPPPAPREN